VPRLSWSATAEYAVLTGSGLTAQFGAALRRVGRRVNGTTERQRVTAPGDPSTVLQEVVTPPLRLDSYHALDLYAGLGRGPWELRAYVNNVTDERAWSSMTLIAGALSEVPAQISAVPIQPRTVGIE